MDSHPRNVVHVAIDEHKSSYTLVAAHTAEPGARPAVRMAANPGKLSTVLTRLSSEGEVIVYYEAGPGGFYLQREMAKRGWECRVVAPSLIPRKPGARKKTDRLDAENMAMAARAGQLTFCSVPTPEQEAVRSLVRVRESFREDAKRTKQRIIKFLRTSGIVYQGGSSNWTKEHRRFLASLGLSGPASESLGELLAALTYLESRLSSLDQRIGAISAEPPWKTAVAHLRCLRGIDTLSAMVILSEIGDFTRFASAPALMGFVGLVPGERSTGESRRSGPITKTGNKRVRRILVEAAQSSKRWGAPGRVVLSRREGQPAAVVSIASVADRRLSSRYHHLHKTKASQVAVIAIARELIGFVWAIMKETRAQEQGGDAITAA